MLKIKMARFGKKKQPTYRLIINEAGRDTYGKALENLGNYDPRVQEARCQS
jgi:ribosomal protein S16